MPIQQLYFGRGTGALTPTKMDDISLITLSPLSKKASQAQSIQKRRHHRPRQITRKFRKMKRRKSPKATMIFSVPQCQKSLAKNHKEEVQKNPSLEVTTKSKEETLNKHAQQKPNSK